GAPTLQTAWFIGSVLTELAFMYSIRTKKVFYKAKFPSHIVVGFSIIAALLALILPYTSIGGSLFRFEHLNPQYLGIVFGLVALYFVLTEVAKNWYYHFAANSKNKKKGFRVK